MPDLDRVDARLREYAARWRAEATQPASVLERLPTRPHGFATRTARRTSWIAGLSAAATVAAGIGLGALLVRHDDSPRPPDPTQTVAVGDVIPWAPLPATHAEIPTHTTPASPDPVEAIGKPTCRASDLRARTRLGGAAGSTYLNVRLVLVGKDPCRLRGWPDLEFLDNGQPVNIPTEREDDSGTYRDPVLVAPGRPAMVRLGWDNDWCAPPVHNDAIVLVLDNYLLTFPGFGDSPSCNGTPGGGPTPVRIGTFEPAKSIEAQLQTPYADLQVTGNLNLTSTPGTELKFTVTMTSPANLVLDPCPDYRIVLSGDDDTQDDLYALNCAALPYRNDRGQPYLPAGIPVSFDMRATPRTTPGEYKFTWLLDTVDQRGTSGDLTLEAPR